MGQLRATVLNKKAISQYVGFQNPYRQFKKFVSETVSKKLSH